MTLEHEPAIIKTLLGPAQNPVPCLVGLLCRLIQVDQSDTLDASPSISMPLPSHFESNGSRLLFPAAIIATPSIPSVTIYLDDFPTGVIYVVTHQIRLGLVYIS